MPVFLLAHVCASGPNRSSIDRRTASVSGDAAARCSFAARPLSFGAHRRGCPCKVCDEPNGRELIMVSTDVTGAEGAATHHQIGLLDKERTIAAPGFNRWLVPPAALAIHLSIGMAYGFSVFWLPLSRAIGITHSTPDDWKVSTLGWMYTLFFVFLGSSAALFGPWVEREGPRKAGVVAACCWGGSF